MKILPKHAVGVDSESHLPLVSIVICCFNRADMLRQTIDSALQQKYPNVEIIVYDDGSTDETPRLAASYGEQIKYIQARNQGIAIARTQACIAAQGKYIAFLDDDDLMPEDRVTNLLSALKRHPQAAFAVGELATIDQNNQIVFTPDLSGKKEHLYPNGLEAVFWPPEPPTVHTTLFRRADGESIDWFDPSYLNAGEDKDFLARLSDQAPIVYLPEIVSLYRRGHASLTIKNSRVHLAQLRLFHQQLSRGSALTRHFRERLFVRVRVTLQQFHLANDYAASAMDIRPYQQLLPARHKLKLRYFYLKQFIKRVARVG